MSLPRKLAFPIIAGMALATCGCSPLFGGESREDGGKAMTSADFAALRNFDRIAAIGPDNVVVTLGNGFSVRADGDRKAIDRLKIDVAGGELRIGRRKEHHNMWGFDGWGRRDDGRDVTIYVTMPAIRAASLAGSGDLRVDRATGTALDLSIVGSGDMRVGAIKVAALRTSVVGSGNMDLSGSADSASLSIAGSGDIDAPGLKAGSTNVSIAGSGDVAVASDGKAAVSIMGSGDVRIMGRAQCSVSTMGSGEAECG